jgi:hypothetical protein
MYEMKGALLCPQPVRAIPLVTGTVVKVIHVLMHRLSTAGQECRCKRLDGASSR